jgi:hypothetical protein
METETKTYAPWVETCGLRYPYGECQCGCGNDAPIADQNRDSRGWLKGHPARFIGNHHKRTYGLPEQHAPWVKKYGLEYPYGKCQCGCGQDAPIAKKTSGRTYLAKGKPVRYIAGHNAHPTLTLNETFLALLPVGEDNACWEWPMLKPDTRYGTLTYYYRHYYAHRLSYEVHHGPIPDGMIVCHRCDNPPCCNPAHLFLGTDQDNSNDKLAKGRQTRGEDLHAAKLTENQVLEMRYLYSTGWLQEELSAAFGVTRSNVSMVIAGKTWKHLPGAMEQDLRHDQRERIRRYGHHHER